MKLALLHDFLMKDPEEGAWFPASWALQLISVNNRS